MLLEKALTRQAKRTLLDGKNKNIIGEFIMCVVSLRCSIGF